MENRAVSLAFGLIVSWAAMPAAHAQVEVAKPVGESAQKAGVGKKLLLVRREKVKLTSLPASTRDKLVKTASPKGKAAITTALAGGCEEGDGNSSESCGGDDDGFERFDYTFTFDSLFNSAGANAIASVSILERVEITGARTVIVSASTAWGEFEALLEQLRSDSFGSIGIGPDDGSEILKEAEKKRTEPQRLPKVTVAGTKSRDWNLQWIFANAKLNDKYPGAILGDTATVQYDSEGCVLFIMIPKEGTPNLYWSVKNEYASCN